MRVQYEKYFTSSEIFPYNIFRAFRRGKYTEKSGTSKIFPYCTSKCLITSLSWPKKYSANFLIFLVSCLFVFCFFLFPLLPVSNFSLFECRTFECRTFEFLNIRTLECSSQENIQRFQNTFHFLKKLQNSQTSDISCITVLLFCLGLGHSLLIGIKFIQRIHPSRPWFNRLRKTNYRTLLLNVLWQSFYNFHNEMCKRVLVCLDCINRPIVKENFGHCRHTTGRMKLIMTTDRDNRFVFRGSNFKKSQSWSYYSYWSYTTNDIEWQFVV